MTTVEILLVIGLSLMAVGNIIGLVAALERIR